jgi:hypothetical protein
MEVSETSDAGSIPAGATHKELFVVNAIKKSCGKPKDFLSVWSDGIILQQPSLSESHHFLFRCLTGTFRLHTSLNLFPES